MRRRQACLRTALPGLSLSLLLSLLLALPGAGSAWAHGANLLADVRLEPPNAPTGEPVTVSVMVVDAYRNPVPTAAVSATLVDRSGKARGPAVALAAATGGRFAARLTPPAGAEQVLLESLAADETWRGLLPLATNEAQLVMPLVHVEAADDNTWMWVAVGALAVAVLAGAYLALGGRGQHRPPA